MARIKRQPNASTAAQPSAAGTVTAARKEQVPIWCYVAIKMRQNICHFCQVQVLHIPLLLLLHPGVC
jgi:hypothetical protein